MVGQSIVVTSSYSQIISSAAVATGSWSALSDSVASALAATEEDYPVLDFQILITAETFADGETLALYRVPGDGTSYAPNASAYSSNTPHYIDAAVAEGGATTLYIYGVENIDKNDKFQILNNSANSATFSVMVRGRTLNTAT